MTIGRSQIFESIDPFATGGDVSATDTTMQDLAGRIKEKQNYDQNFAKYEQRLAPYAYEAPRMSFYDLASELGAGLLATPNTGGASAFTGLGVGFSNASAEMKQKQEAYAKAKQEIGLQAAQMAMQDEQKATEFFNRYNEDQDRADKQHDLFKSKTKQVFNDDFKGFDFNLGDKKFRYGLQNKEAVAESQSNINNFVGKFLDSEGNIKDAQGYHKAIYAAENSDKLASHFYQQGKADATRDIMSKSKNVTSSPRQTNSSEYIGGFKVKSVNGGSDSSKLSIKKNKFN